MNWKEKYKHFRKWQETPYQVAQMATEEHECPTCHTQFQGNYCPRCGQSARIGRYSFKAAFLLFLDVWGMGNRGMFRTLRDLLLRPGYMIRDYLSGMQMAYFPPFKMLFLLTALSLIVAHGVNIKGKTMEDQQQEILSSVHQTQGEGADVVIGMANNYVNWIFEIQERFPNSFTLLTVLLLTSFYYIFFRKAKTVDHLRFSEFLIAMIYVVNMLTIYETVFAFFGASTTVITCLSPQSGRLRIRLRSRYGTTSRTYRPHYQQVNIREALRRDYLHGTRRRTVHAKRGQPTLPCRKHHHPLRTL